MTPDAQAWLARADDALAEGDFVVAWEATERALELDGDRPEAHELIGRLAYADGRFTDVVPAWEQAFRGYRARSELQPAARIAIGLAGLHAAAFSREAAAQGWTERARVLLDRIGPCAEWGYWELAVMGCDRLDLDGLLASADRALSIAIDHDDPTLEALAMAEGGLALVSHGRISEGFARLDAALAAITAGEVRFPHAGLCFCSMLTACDRAGDVRRAKQWTEMMTEITDQMDGRPQALWVHCRVAYGSVLWAAGRWPEAEALMIEALGPADSPNLAHRALNTAHLAGLRLDQGRVEEAAQLLEPYEDWVSCCGPLAEVHLRRGDLDLAAAVLRQGAQELVGDALRIAPLLVALVDVDLRRGDVDAARVSAGRLTDLVATTEHAALHADAALAEARILVALGDQPAARDAFALAKQHLASDERPLQLGLVRLELAEALAADGNGPDAIVEGRAALATFERLGAAPARDRASSLLRRLGDTGRVAPRHVDEVRDTLTRRELEVLELVREGLTNAQIAERLFISPKTAEHHVGRILAKLGVRSRAEAAALAVRLGT